MTKITGYTKLTGVVFGDSSTPLPPTTNGWSSTYSYSGSDGGAFEGAQIDSAGAVIALGVTNGISNYTSVVKYNSNGSTAWQKYIGNTSVFNQLYANFTVTDSSNNVYAFIDDERTGYNNTVIVKFAADGSLVWQKRVNVENVGLVSCKSSTAKVVADGILVACSITDGTPQYPWPAVMKIDFSGNIVWTSSTKRELSSFTDLCLLPFGECMLVSQDYNTHTIYFDRISSLGSLTWSKSLAISYPSGNLIDVTRTDNGNIIIANGTYLACIDDTGAFVWSNIYSMPGFFISLKSAGNNVYAADNNGNFIKVDSTNGNLVYAYGAVTSDGTFYGAYYAGGHDVLWINAKGDTIAFAGYTAAYPSLGAVLAVPENLPTVAPNGLHNVTNTIAVIPNNGSIAVTGTLTGSVSSETLSLTNYTIGTSDELISIGDLTSNTINEGDMTAI